MYPFVKKGMPCALYIYPFGVGVSIGFLSLTQRVFPTTSIGKDDVSDRFPAPFLLSQKPNSFFFFHSGGVDGDLDT